MEAVVQNAIDIALDGAIDLIKWEINNAAWHDEIQGLKRAVEIIEELHGRFHQKMDTVNNA